MAQNQTGQKHDAAESATMLAWRINRAEIERQHGKIDRDLLHRQHQG